MDDARGVARLLEEPRGDVGIAGDVGMDDLDRDRAVERGVVRRVDLAHGALAEQRAQLVVGEARAGREHAGRAGLWVGGGRRGHGAGV